MRQSAPGYKIGTESKGYKDMSTRKDVPGPGQYEYVVTKETTGHVFGSAQREQVRDSGMPGPGQYAQQGVIGKDSQGKTMGMRLTDKQRDDVPGPGQYEYMRSTGEGPKWVMSSEARSKEMRGDAPGPGAYEYKAQGEGPGWVMGTSTRTDLARGTDSPGPGQYKYYLH